MNPAVVSVLIALYTAGDPSPDVILRFVDPAKCREAAAIYNELLPKVVSIGKASTRKSTGKIDKVLRYVCLDGIANEPS